MNTLYSWNMLGTLAGAATIAYLIVAYTKDLFVKSKLGFLGVDIYAAFISFVVLLASWVATIKVVTWRSVLSLVGLAIFNAFLVAAAAAKMNDKAISSKKKAGE